MNFKLPIAKGVVSAFDEILKDMHNLLLISRMHQTHEELPAEYKEAFQMYTKITENSTEDECFKMIKLLKDFSIKEESVAKGDKETAIKGKNSIGSICPVYVVNLNFRHICLRCIRVGAIYFLYHFGEKTPLSGIC